MNPEIAKLFEDRYFNNSRRVLGWELMVIRELAAEKKYLNIALPAPLMLGVLFEACLFDLVYAPKIALTNLSKSTRARKNIDRR